MTTQIDKTETMSTGDWFFTMLVLEIPVVNIFVFFLWLCGLGSRSRVTFCRACLLWLVVFTGLFVSLCAVDLVDPHVLWERTLGYMEASGLDIPLTLGS